MDDTEPTDHAHFTREEQDEQESARLHRLVLPMILDMLRARGYTNALASANNHSSEGEGRSSEDNDAFPLSPSSLSPSPSSSFSSPSPSSTQDEDEEEEFDSDLSYLFDEQPPLDTQPPVNQQGQHIPPSPSSPLLSPRSPSYSPRSPSSTHTRRRDRSPPRRPRYRLVVYFEEREAPVDDSARTTDTSTEEDPLTPPRAGSRYVAVFSIDSDVHNMPVIHSAGLHNTPASFDDILNHLFNSYVPKGTPPAKKEIIDALPTSTYSDSHCSQPKCAVCLEDFVEGAEMVELPCSHRFHGEACVKPWLRLHSSCPVCRYEMPVDDVEYEEERVKRMADRAPIENTQDALPVLNPFTDDFSLL